MTLTVVNPYAGGHFGQYLHALLHGWPQWRTHGGSADHRLVVVVGPRVTREHPEVARLAREVGAEWTETQSDLLNPHSLRVREMWMARTLRDATYQTRPDHLFLTYVDHALLTAAFAPIRAPLSGIFFRPSFHYTALGSPPVGAREHLRETVKRELLRQVLRRMHRLFTPDASAVLPMRRLTRPDVPVALPEVLDRSVLPRRPAFLDALVAGRQVLLCVGALDSRKGIGVTMEALLRLPRDVRERLTLLLAGRLEPTERREHLLSIDRLRRDGSLHVVHEDRYLDEAEIQPTIEAADLVLVPYQRHVGSSGILIRAATAGRPVLASSYGLVGAHVRTHRLGEAVDASSPDALAAAIRRHIEGCGAGARFDPAKAAAFADGNTAEAYAETIFRHLLAA